MGKSKDKIKPDLDGYRLKLILDNIDKPLSYEKRKFKSYDDTEDFKRY